MRQNCREKYEAMAQMYRQGLTLAMIGKHYGTSRQYIEQCLKKIGVGAADGGQAIKSEIQRKDKERQKRLSVARIEAKWGVDHALWKALRADGTLHAYERQRQNARNRGIEWALSFSDWYAVWQASGKFDLRGKGKGKYCMSRIKDDGGYKVGNVHVQLCTVNSQEAVEQWAGKPPKRFQGVFHLYPGLENGWLAKYSNKSLGYFPSAEAAHTARQEYMAANNLKPRGAMRGIYIQPRPGCFALTLDGRQLATFATHEAAAVARATMLAA